jgi:hypothetical protein
MALQKPVIVSYWPDSSPAGDGNTDANILTLNGTSAAASTITVYDGTTVLGTTTANSNGVWIFETPKLADTTHSFAATASDQSGVTSTPSVALSVKVVPSITHFSGTSNNWHDPIFIDSQPWFVENGTESWSLTAPDSHTIRTEVRPGDVWADDGTARSEVLTVTNALDHQVFNTAYTMTIEPGQVNNVSWLSLTQMHGDSDIPFSIQLRGDHMSVAVNLNASSEQQVYYDPNLISRGHAYDIQIRANFATDSSGFLQIWRDGVEIVDYHGQLGPETGGQYLKLGIYEGEPDSVTHPMAVDYSNIELSYNDPNFLTPNSTPTTSPSAPVPQPTNDIGGNGHGSILWQNTNGTAAIWSVNGTSLVSGATLGFNPGSSWHVIGSGDFDGDGKSDILWQNNDGTPAVWKMDGSNILSGANVGFNPGASWHVIGSGDFNGDGKADILWQNQNGQAAVWLMDGQTLKSGTNVGANPGADWHVIGSGDFNGDGKADILWQNNNGQAAVWLMNGSNLISGANVGVTPGADWHVRTAGDFNGDGKADILWQNSNGQAAVWLMDGTSLIAGADVGVNPGADWHVQTANDFNGDGKADILWQNTNGQAAVWLMNGVNVLAGSNVGFDPGASWHVIPQHHDVLV